MTDRTIYHGRCCVDCLMLIANGDTSGNPRCETPEGEAAYLADVAARTAGYHVVPSSWPGTDWTDEDRHYGRDCEPRFTWHGSCDTCSTTLGGDRHPIAMWEIGR